MPRASSGPQLRASAKKDGIWYIHWTERRGGRSVSRERSTGTRDSAEAHRIYAEWLDSGGGISPKTEWYRPHRAAQARIADVLDVYAQEHVAGHTAAPERAGYAIQALLGFWGERTCDYIKPETCRAYVRWRMYGHFSASNDRHTSVRDGYDARGGAGAVGRSNEAATRSAVSQSTAARELVVLRAALGYAVKNGKLIERPFVEVPGKGPGRDRWLTRSEVARLLWESRKGHAARDYLPLFIMLALRTGARPGALFDLQWPQIDFTNNRIDFNPPGRERTNKQRSIIAIPRRLRWFLLRAHARATSPYVLAFRGRKLDRVDKSFSAARARAGLGWDVVPYVLRHTAGTWMAQAGVPLWQISGWLGHTQSRTTELYAHHSPDFFEQARKVMD